MAEAKSAYICGPLTELLPEEQGRIKRFYARIADLFEELTGVRAFVPHEHYDPVVNPNPTPAQVDAAERKQVCENSSMLVVVAEAPSWGGGIEVEMARTNGVPVVLLCDREKLAQRKISRLLRGNPAVVKILEHDNEEDALSQLRDYLMFGKAAS